MSTAPRLSSIPNPLVQNSNTVAAPATQTGSVVQGIGADGVVVRIEIDATASTGFFTTVRRDGTLASPSAVLAGEQIGGFNGMGYTSAAAVSNPIASFRVYALENLTGSAQGGIASIAAIPSGSTTLADQLTVYGSTGVGIGLASATTVPAAKLEVAGSIKFGTSNQVTISAAGVAAIPASLAIGGATIGTDALGVTGTVSISGALSLATKLTPSNGGIGAQTNFAVGDILYADSTTTLTKLADVATGSVLISGGVGVAPAWSVSPSVTTLTGLLIRTNSTTTNSNFFTNATSSTGFSAADLTAALQFGGSTNVQYRWGSRGSTGGALTAAVSAANVILGGSGMTEATSGVHAILANVAILASAITDGTATTTDATTLLVVGPPTGTATITNAASAAWFQTGDVVHGSAAIATNATSGFTYIATCAGTPTGTPTTRTGLVPMVFDTTNSQFWFYSGGAWKQPKTPAGAAIVTWQ